MKKDKATGILDFNIFLVSCERAVNPALNKRPVVVLSHNDGCVISRSDEVKAMGVKMAQPLFQVRKMLEQNITDVPAVDQVYVKRPAKTRGIHQRFRDRG